MVDETTSTNRNLIIALAVGALLLAFVVVAVVLILVFMGGDTGEGATEAGAARLMPEDTIGFGFFNPHLDEAANFEVLDKAWGDNPVLRKGLAELLDSMKEEGLDYKVDIESWLGDEVAFSMGPNFLGALSGSIDRTFEEIESTLSGGFVESVPTPAVSEMPQLVLAMATKDTTASDNFMKKLQSEIEEDDTAWQEIVHNDVAVVYYEPKSEWDVGAAYATVEDFVVLTVGDLEVMKEIIDVSKGDGDNLAENENFKDVMAKLPAEQIGYGYLDIGAYMDAMLEALGPEMAEIPAELFDPEQLKALRGVGFSMGLESNGMRMDFVTVYDKDALPEILSGFQAGSNKSAGRVPADTLLYLSSSGLGNIIQVGLDAIEAMPDQSEDLTEQLEMATAMLGVSVQDMIQMLSGEYAIAVTHDPAGIGGDPSIPVGASFLMEATDEYESKFKSLINSVSMLLALGGEMEFPKETLSGVDVTMVPGPTSDSMIVGWGVGEGFFAIGTSKELLETAFGGGGDKLADAAMYKDATAALPDELASVMFVNIDGLFKILVEAMDPWAAEDFEEVRPFIQPIKAISAGSEAFDADKDSMSGTFFILIESE